MQRIRDALKTVGEGLIIVFIAMVILAIIVGVWWLDRVRFVF